MPIDSKKVLAAAQKHVERKNFDQALVEYEQVAEDYVSHGFRLKAVAVYKKIRGVIEEHAPQLESKYAHITPKLAELYRQLGMTSDAVAVLDKVATRLPVDCATSSPAVEQIEANWKRRARFFHYVRGIAAVLVTVAGWADGPFPLQNHPTGLEAAGGATLLFFFLLLLSWSLRLLLLGTPGRWAQRNPLADLGRSGHPFRREVLGAYVRESCVALLLMILAFDLGLTLSTYWAALRGYYS